MPAISARQIGTRRLRLLGVAVQRSSPISAFMARVRPRRPQYDARCLVRRASPDLDPRALRPAPGRLTRVSTRGGWSLARRPPRTSRHPAPVRLEICLLNIGGTPDQEWPLTILTQEEWRERRVVQESGRLVS